LNNLGLLVIYVVAFIAIFYFLAIRPQQRQRRSHDALVGSLKRGDRVVTAGGVFATIKRVEENVLTVEIAKGVDIRIARRAVSEVLADEPTGNLKGSKVIEPAADEPLEDEDVADEDVVVEDDDETAR
jgi:preprotein translocase subunit YajC